MTVRYTDVGNGTSIVFGTSGFAAKLIDLDGPGLERPSIEVTTMDTVTAKEFIPGDLYDPGQLDVEFAYDPSLSPPIDQPPEVITITWPKHVGVNTPATWVGTGFLTKYQGGAKLDQRMTAKGTIRFSGVVIITPAT